ncbi:MAG TPA: dTMP kinase [Candidatus Omnitrophota bacterium]|nr:dTMP kinase [Candidatus Omnitrophota bacterium]
MIKGKFITFEGSEGSGKSTQIELIKKYLKRKGRSVLFVREPGGVAISEKIRRILLDAKNVRMGKECETFLYMAARAQLVAEVIRPALQKGKIILCDRFLDSTLAYQGYGCGVDLALIKKMGAFATQGITPDLTLVFDIEPQTGLSRIHRKKDRIERRKLSYHQKVRRGYLTIARQEPKRVKVIKVNGSPEIIHAKVKAYIERLLKM